MAKENMRKKGQQVFALLQTEGPDTAPANFVRLCAFCALEALDFLPLGFCEKTPTQPRLDDLCRSLHRGLPQIFEPIPYQLKAHWFLPGGAAALLRALYQSRPTQQVYGLSGRLWEACAELPRRQSFAELRQSGHHVGKNAAYATQLFTPDWLGHFLMENSIGRLLGQTDPYPYYMGDNSGSIPADAAQITVLDPCAGGGELLCRAFDLIYPRLTAGGMTPDRAVQHLLEKTLFGLDLDENALNVCRLELMLRGRRCDRDILERGLSLQLAAANYADGGFCPAGSLMAPCMDDFDRLSAKAADLLAQQYDVVATNPPYMGLRGMTPPLRSFLRQHYPAGRADLYAAFALRCLQLTKPNGYAALLMPQGWLTLANFKELRQTCFDRHIPVLLKLGSHAFPDIVGEVVQTAALVLGNRPADGPTALCDLSRYTNTAAKEAAFLAKEYRLENVFLAQSQTLPKGCRPLGQTARICQGLATGNNRRFVRLWYEVDPKDIGRDCPDRKAAAQSGKRWFPYHKGGGCRPWWGNDLYVVDFADDGAEIRRQTAANGRARARVQNADHYFRPGVTYSFVGSKNFSARIAPTGAIFDVGGSTAFPHDGNCLTLAALMNSAPAHSWLLRRNPTVNFQVGDLAALPCPDLGEYKTEVEALAQTCADLARRQWEETEPAPNFTVHPWASEGADSLRQAAHAWLQRRTRENQTFAEAQHRLDQIFAGLMAEELSTDLPRPQAPDLQEECRLFVSWCVGKAVGRFDGLATDCLSLQKGTDSLAARVQKLLYSLWGEKELADSLAFLSEQLGCGLEEYFQGKFFAHHNKLYHNCPVYWLCPHKENPVLLYYHGLCPATAKKLGKLWGSITPQLKQAQKAWANPDKNKGIAHHILAAAELGLAKLPPALTRKQKERKIQP